jgi:hypothetical protein
MRATLYAVNHGGNEEDFEPIVPQPEDDPTTPSE